MGRGQENTAIASRNILPKIKKEILAGKDLPPFVEKITFREGFRVSFVHEARKGQIFEVPHFSHQQLKRPSLLASFEVNEKDFKNYDETLDFSPDDNLKERMALYLSNRLLSWTEGLASKNIPKDYSYDDPQKINEKIPLQDISFEKGKIIYSLTLS